MATPVLPGKLTGPAYLDPAAAPASPTWTSCCAATGVELVLVGHTQIKAGTITSKFETLPDAPITSATVMLPVGPRSLLAANGNLCRTTLSAPTTLIAQSGARINGKTKITVSSCPVEVISHRTSGNKAILTVLAPAAGRLSVSGRDVHTLKRRVGKAGKVKLTVQLTTAGVARRLGSKRMALKLRVGFVPRSGHAVSKAFATVTFHR